MRRLLVIGSVAGAPGVTTTALALAAAWPIERDGSVRPVMVEADGSGGDLMIRFGLGPSPSLLDVAAAAGQPQPGSLLGAVRELPSGVRVVASVPGRGPCSEAVRLVASHGGRRVLLGEEHDIGTVIVDVGRICADVEPLLTEADELVLVTRGGPEALTQVAACGLDEKLRADGLTLLVVGPCPYPAEEIAQVLSVERVVLWPWDAKSAAAVSCSGPRPPRTSGWRVPRLIGAARSLAEQLAVSADGLVSLAAGASGTGLGDSRTPLAGRMRVGLAGAPREEGSAT